MINSSCIVFVFKVNFQFHPPSVRKRLSGPVVRYWAHVNWTNWQHKELRAAKNKTRKHCWWVLVGPARSTAAGDTCRWRRRRPCGPSHAASWQARWSRPNIRHRRGDAPPTGPGCAPLDLFCWRNTPCACAQVNYGPGLSLLLSPLVLYGCLSTTGRSQRECSRCRDRISKFDQLFEGEGRSSIKFVICRQKLIFYKKRAYPFQ